MDRLLVLDSDRRLDFLLRALSSTIFSLVVLLCDSSVIFLAGLRCSRADSSGKEIMESSFISCVCALLLLAVLVRFLLRPRRLLAALSPLVLSLLLCFGCNVLWLDDELRLDRLARLVGSASPEEAEVVEDLRFSLEDNDGSLEWDLLLLVLLLLLLEEEVLEERG